LISNKCQYALRAVLELSKQEKLGHVPISAIAKAQNIPPRFLEAILRQLKQAGLTESIRGKDGGYRLARSASEITMAEVVTLFEGALTERARASEPDVFSEVWDQAETSVSNIFSSITFAELRQKDEDRRIDLSQNYSI